MQCEAFERRLNQLLDRRRPVESDDRLLAHAHVCRRCRRMLEGQRLLLDVLQFGETPEPADDLASRVVSRHVAVQQAERQRKRGARRFVRTVSALAAIGLVALFLTAWSSGPNRETIKNRVAADAPAPAAANALHGRPSQPVLRASAAAAPTTLRVAASETASAQSTDFELYHELFDVFQTASVDDLVAGASLAEPTSNDTEAADSGEDQVAMLLGDWRMRMSEIPAEPLQVEQITGGLKPITEPFGVAFDLLWQSIPSEKTAVKKPQAGGTPRVGNARFS